MALSASCGMPRATSERQALSAEQLHAHPVHSRALCQPQNEPRRARCRRRPAPAPHAHPPAPCLLAPSARAASAPPPCRATATPAREPADPGRGEARGSAAVRTWPVGRARRRGAGATASLILGAIASTPPMSAALGDAASVRALRAWLVAEGHTPASASWLRRMFSRRARSKSFIGSGSRTGAARGPRHAPSSSSEPLSAARGQCASQCREAVARRAPRAHPSPPSAFGARCALRRYPPRKLRTGARPASSRPTC